MVKHIAKVEWLVVRDEIEALLTEANLIKEHQPRYNILLKDDKTFPYICITNEPYPRVEIVRAKNLTKDKNTYFGPYTDARYLRNLLRLLHKIFPLRTCNYFIDDKSIKTKKVSVCLDYHINKCEGPCEGLVSQSYYNKMINQIKLFLKGRNKEIITNLKDKMNLASNELRFEEAVNYRDQLNLPPYTKQQKIVSQDFMDRDVLAIASEESYGVGVLMRIRNGHLIGKEKFELKISEPNKLSIIMSQFLTQYYNVTKDIPKEIVLQTTIDELSQVKSWLSAEKGQKVKILIPERGEKKEIN